MDTDSQVLALLRAVPNLRVHDGQVEADDDAKVISTPMPYIVFWSNAPRDLSDRFCGIVAAEATDFRITGVGETRESAKWALDRAHRALSRKRLDRYLIRRYDNSEPVRRDDEYTRPGGEPIFYGSAQYGVGKSIG